MSNNANAAPANRLMMVGGWTEIYEKAKACGFEVTLAQDKHEVKAKDVELVDRLITIKKNDPFLPKLAAAMHEEKPFDAVLSFQEHGVMNAALIGDNLGLHGNPLRPVVLTRDKGEMRQHMRDAGIASIPFVVACCAEDVVQFTREHGWPIIMKPVSGSGSLQVHKLTQESEIAPALDEIRQFYPGMNPIAEKFMVGPEVSVEAISWNGQHSVIGVTDKMTTGAPYFVETGHNMPSQLPPETLQAIHKLTVDFLNSIGHLHGPSHTEVIVSESGPIIVESHTRTGGDRIFEMVELTYGIDMFSATLKGFAGQYPEFAPHPARGSAIRFLTYPEGVVKSISGIDDAKNSAGVVRFDFKLEVGQTIKPFKQSAERYGFVLAIGENLQEAVDNVNAAIAKIKVEVEAQ